MRLKLFCQRHLIFIRFIQECSKYGLCERVTSLQRGDKVRFLGNCFYFPFNSIVSQIYKGIILRCRRRHEVQLIILDEDFEYSNRKTYVLEQLAKKKDCFHINWHHNTNYVWVHDYNWNITLYLHSLQIKRYKIWIVIMHRKQNTLFHQLPFDVVKYLCKYIRM